MVIDVIILCGGKGTRLKTVVNDRPKSMALINGKPFLFYLLKQISSYGFKRVILCTGYKSNFIRETFGDKFDDIDLVYSEETEPLGTGGAVRLALSKIVSDYVLVMNGDSYIDVNLNDFVNWGLNSDVEGGILLTEVDDVSRYGSVNLDNKSKIVSFKEKDLTSGRGLINSGVYIFKKDLLLKMPEAIQYSMEREYFLKLVLKKQLFGRHLAGKFIDIGTPKSYKKAELFFKNVT